MFNAVRHFSFARRAIVQGGVLLSAVVLALGTFGEPALAQDAKPAAAKKGAKAASKKAPSTWVKICNQPKKGQVKGCITRSDIIEHEVMQVYGIVGIETVEGKAEKSLIATLPYAVITSRKVKNPKTNQEVTMPATLQFTWNVSSIVKAKIDDTEITLKMLYCYRIGCVASATINDDVIAKMKKGKEIAIIGETFGRGGSKGRQIPLPVSLNGFTAAIDGKPVDNKKYETFWGREILRRNLAKLDMQNKALKQAIEKKKAAKAASKKGDAQKKK